MSWGLTALGSCHLVNRIGRGTFGVLLPLWLLEYARHFLFGTFVRLIRYLLIAGLSDRSD
jgi:hypothetical protein